MSDVYSSVLSKYVVSADRGSRAMITVFKTETCAYCPMVIKLLDKKKAEYQIKEAYSEEHLKLAEHYGTNVPFTYNDKTGTAVMGFDQGKLIKLIEG